MDLCVVEQERRSHFLCGHARRVKAEGPTGPSLHAGLYSSMELGRPLPPQLTPPTHHLFTRLQTFQPPRAGLPRASPPAFSSPPHLLLCGRKPHARCSLPRGPPASLAHCWDPCQGQESWGCHSGPWAGPSLGTAPGSSSAGQVASGASACAAGHPFQSGQVRKGFRERWRNDFSAQQPVSSAERSQAVPMAATSLLSQRTVTLPRSSTHPGGLTWDATPCCASVAAAGLTCLPSSAKVPLFAWQTPCTLASLLLPLSALQAQRPERDMPPLRLPGRLGWE